MIVRILGSRRRLPQWNCYCEARVAARGLGAGPTANAVVDRLAPGRPWYLNNASPTSASRSPTCRASGQSERLPRDPVRGILLTDAEIDHTAGLLLMREPNRPLRIFSTRPAHEALTHHYPVPLCCAATAASSGRRSSLGDARPRRRLRGRAVRHGRRPAALRRRRDPDLVSVGLTIRDRTTGESRRAPALEATDDAVSERFEQ